MHQGADAIHACAYVVSSHEHAHSYADEAMHVCVDDACMCVCLDITKAYGKFVWRSDVCMCCCCMHE